MTLTVRLDPAIDEQLSAHCRRERVSKSELVNRLLKSFLERERLAKSFYDDAKEAGLIGCVAGTPDLSVNRKRYLRARQLRDRRLVRRRAG